jgi:hypothetical protein
MLIQLTLSKPNPEKTEILSKPNPEKTEILYKPNPV